MAITTHFMIPRMMINFILLMNLPWGNNQNINNVSTQKTKCEQIKLEKKFPKHGHNVQLRNGLTLYQTGA